MNALFRQGLSGGQGSSGGLDDGASFGTAPVETTPAFGGSGVSSGGGSGVSSAPGGSGVTQGTLGTPTPIVSTTTTASGRGVLGEDPAQPFVNFVPWSEAVGRLRWDRDGTQERYQRPSGSVAYMEGDAENMLRMMDPAKLGHIQQILSQAGLISGTVQYQMPDNKTVSAFAQVLAMSNRMDLDPTVVLGRLGSSNRDAMLAAMDEAARQSSGPTRAPFTAQVSNPEDLRAYFRNAVVEATGSGDTGVDIDKLVGAYQALERNAQARVYNAAPTGGTVESAPSPGTFAERALQEAAPDQVQANSVVERAGQLFGMLGQFGGQ